MLVSCPNMFGELLQCGGILVHLLVVSTIKDVPFKFVTSSSKFGLGLWSLACDKLACAAACIASSLLIVTTTTMTTPLIA